MYVQHIRVAGKRIVGLPLPSRFLLPFFHPQASFADPHNHANAVIGTLAQGKSFEKERRAMIDGDQLLGQMLGDAAGQAK